jgi:nucleoside 2-deoxyribosyltransferase
VGYARDMKNVFLATSFAHVIDADSGDVIPEFRKKVEEILRSLRTQAQVKVYCELEDAEWHMPGGLPERAAIKDINTLDEADLLLCLVAEHPTVGAEFEMGYMVAKGKPVLLAMSANGQLANFNQGLISAGLVTLITYDNASSLAKQLAIAVNAPKEVLTATV